NRARSTAAGSFTATKIFGFPADSNSHGTGRRSDGSRERAAAHCSAGKTPSRSIAGVVSQNLGLSVSSIRTETGPTFSASVNVSDAGGTRPHLRITYAVPIVGWQANCISNAGVKI